jgi:transcriptional regulator with XRE-family HTH domain
MFETGLFIYSYRLKKGITQAKLAQKAGIPQPNLSNIEKGKQDLTVSTLKRIAQALEVPAALLLEDRPSGKERPFLLTRPFMEEVAQAVVNPKARVSTKAREMGGLFRKILPTEGEQAKSLKETNFDWITLRSKLTSEQIRAIHQRVQDARQRQKK